MPLESSYTKASIVKIDLRVGAQHQIMRASFSREKKMGGEFGKTSKKD